MRQFIKQFIKFQFIKFTMVGATNSIIYVGVFQLFIFFAPGTAGLMIGQGLAWVFSVFNGFVWSRRFVFPHGHLTWLAALVRVYLGYGAGLIMSTISSYVLAEIFHVPHTFVPFINLPLMGIVNFFIIKYFAFGGTGKK